MRAQRAALALAALMLAIAAAPLAADSARDGGEDAVASSEPTMPPVGVTVKRHDWSWTLIDERGLALGGGGLEADDLEDLRARGFGAVINYRGERPNEGALVAEAGMDYLFLHNTYAEEDTMPLEHVIEAVAFIERNLEAGEPVFVHCTGGWHRSAVGVVAYFMKTRAWRFEEAWDHVASIRPGIEPRYADALLEYEAHLFGEPKLTLDLWTARWDIEPNETVVIDARVTHNGIPVPGAHVAFAADHGPSRDENVTDDEGRTQLRFTATDAKVQYVHATASKEGLIAGYDRNVFWVKSAKFRAPTVMELEGWTGVAQPGEAVAFLARVAEEDGGRANARITVTTPCETLHRDYTGWDGEGEVSFRAPSREGTYPVLVVANRFPAQPVEMRLELVVGRGGGMPACEAPEPFLDPEVVEASKPSRVKVGGAEGSGAVDIGAADGPAGIRAFTDAKAQAAATLGFVAVGALLFGRRRKRA